MTTVHGECYALKLQQVISVPSQKNTLTGQSPGTVLNPFGSFKVSNLQREARINEKGVDFVEATVCPAVFNGKVAGSAPSNYDHSTSLTISKLHDGLERSCHLK